MEGREALLKPYSPKATELDIYRKWENSDLFSPDICIARGVTNSQSPVFSITLPPPNVTGHLHMGHAMMVAIQDVMVRQKRMQGHRTLWLPGTDHAAIATQSKVEKILEKEGVKKRGIGREAFLKRVDDFAKDSHATITSQIKALGASLDWSREAFTLDKEREVAVRTAFKKMYDDNLIYRGSRITNWDPKLQTTVSDDEIEWKEETTPFYYLQYGPFVIATARPETKFGDKYVVMHPDDQRYTKYRHGEKIDLEWINGPITTTVIKDPAIDMEFGTGVMTITPWHDLTDFEIAEHHNLDKEQIIDLYGKLLPIAGEFSGQAIKTARPEIVKKLEAKGLLVKTDEKYVHRIATNSRGGGVIEPQISRQWFVAVNREFTIPHSQITGIKSGQTTTLKALMKAAVENGQINILPDRFGKVYFSWIDNLRDWCISRQIWYGHRVPVWYLHRRPDADLTQNNAESEEVFVGLEAPDGDDWIQDPDTLDTWFSSGLWTFSTLGWPKETNDLKTYHPTTVLETGYDIIFFWVARMILMSTYLLGDIPFETVYLHGLVRDAKGRKMSKSLGNIVDPQEMIEKYGADATRMSLIIGTGPGNDSKFDENKIRGYKNFANKIWNVSRFVLENTSNLEYDGESPKLTPEHQAYLEELGRLTEEITSDLDHFRFYLAAEKLYHYFWHTFADKILEACKTTLKDPRDSEAALSAKWLLDHILKQSLIMLHPFMPFVTEAVWQLLPHPKPTLLMVEPWPNK